MSDPLNPERVAALVAVAVAGDGMARSCLGALERAGYLVQSDWSDGQPLPSLGVGQAWAVLCDCANAEHLLEALDRSGQRFELVLAGQLELWSARVADRANLLITGGPEVSERLERMAADRLGPAGFAIDLVAFSVRGGPPPDADWVFDVRFLDNPHWVESLRDLDGDDALVSQFVLGQPLAGRFLDQVAAILTDVHGGYARLDKRRLVVGIGCTGGRHRSVAIARELCRRLDGVEGIKASYRRLPVATWG